MENQRTGQTPENFSQYDMKFQFDVQLKQKQINPIKITNIDIDQMIATNANAATS